MQQILPPSGKLINKVNKSRSSIVYSQFKLTVFTGRVPSPSVGLILLCKPHFEGKFMSTSSSSGGKVHIPCCLNSFIISWVQTALQSSSSVFLMKRDRSRKSLLSHERTVTDGDGHFPEGNSPSGSPELIQLHQLVAQLQFLWITNWLMLQPENLRGKLTLG